VNRGVSLGEIMDILGLEDDVQKMNPYSTSMNVYDVVIGEGSREE
jgi:hypothetical protein